MLLYLIATLILFIIIEKISTRLSNLPTNVQQISENNSYITNNNTENLNEIPNYDSIVVEDSLNKSKMKNDKDKLPTYEETIKARF